MSNTAKMPEVNMPEPTQQHRERSLAEWVTFSIASCILLALISLVFYAWVLSQHSPPVLEVEAQGPVRVVEDQFYVPFTVENTGGEIAEAIQVVAELRVDGNLSETGEQQISSLSGGEQKQGSFVFRHDPTESELVLRVASYSQPQIKKAPERS